MSRVVLDDLREGLFLSSNYIRTNYLAESASFGTLFELYHRVGKSAQDADVRNAGPTDTSNVYQIKSKNAQRYMISAEYITNQTNTQILPAPGPGKRYVIEYIAMRTEGTSGVAYLTDGITESKTFKVYFSVQNNASASNLFLPTPENTPVLFTSTQGSKAVFIAIGYHIEVIK